jgi:hypothetical protein
MDVSAHDSRPHRLDGTLTRRTVIRRGGVSAAILGGLTAHAALAQEGTPDVVDISDVSGAVSTLLNVLVSDLPPAPIQVTLVRATTEPETGDLEDYFTFPGPFAFVVESGDLICRCGTEDAPCMLLGPDGSSEPAPPIPADIPLGPGEGLYIPGNTPDSFTVPGPDPVVELDLSIFPAEEPDASPSA